MLQTRAGTIFDFHYTTTVAKRVNDKDIITIFIEHFKVIIMLLIRFILNFDYSLFISFLANKLRSTYE